MLQPFYELGAFPYFLHKFGGIWLHDGSWSQTKGNIDREMRLSPKHEEVGAEPCG